MLPSPPLDVRLGLVDAGVFPSPPLGVHVGVGDAGVLGRSRGRGGRPEAATGAEYPGVRDTEADGLRRRRERADVRDAEADA